MVCLGGEAAGFYGAKDHRRMGQRERPMAKGSAQNSDTLPSPSQENPGRALCHLVPSSPVHCNDSFGDGGSDGDWLEPHDREQDWMGSLPT